MSYMNDPREMTFSSESGAILEQDNRHEARYQWGAMIVDLCDMPVSEYMKPMTVISVGGGDIPDVEEVMYTLKYVIDGEVVLTQEFKSGDVITFDVDAQKEGRNFKGWFNGSTQYSEGSKMPSRNLVITAKYECEVSFVFNIDGEETEILSYVVPFESKLSNIPDTDKEGYDFKGWEPSISETIVRHTKFIGSFQIKTFVVTWEGFEDGSKSETYNYGDTLVTPESPLKEGYTFIGWDKVLPEKVTENLSFNAVFEINQYEIVFSQEWYGVKSELSSITVNYNDVIVLPNIPTENGYTFSEWTGDYTGVNMPSHDIEYVTVKTVNSYILAYYDNNLKVKEEVYEYLSPITPYEYEKEGWTVSEWSNLPETMPYHNVSAHCTSTINVYTVKFTDQNGEVYEVEATHGTLVKDIIPNIEGKTFAIDEDILNYAINKEGLTFEGNVTINDYKVEISIEGVSSEINELPYGTNVREFIEATYPAEEGYTLVVETNYETVPANDQLVVRVSYKANVWKLTYTTNLGHTNSVNVEYNAPIINSLPTIEEEGYNFISWTVDGNIVDETTKMPNGNLEVVGTFAEKMCMVTIKDGDAVKFEQVYKYGTKVNVVLNEDVLVNYVTEQSANGYTVSYELNGSVVDKNMDIKTDIVLNVTKTPNTYVLTFKNGDEIISSTEIPMGTLISYPEMSNKTENGVEYIFVWEDESYNGETMPNMNVVIIGNYQEKAEAPIYYGIFVTPSEIADSKIFNETDFATFKEVSVAKCIDGATVVIEQPADEYLASDEGQELSEEDYDAYLYSHYCPHCFLIPVDISNEYTMVIKDAANMEMDYTSDKVNININGTNYHLYSYLNTDNMVASDVDLEFEYKINLTK